MLQRLRAVALRLAVPAVLATGATLFTFALLGVQHVGDRLDAAARAGTQLRYVDADGTVRPASPPQRCPWREPRRSPDHRF
ncbi:MAG: hypothetical protein QOH43_1735 [Solirubrobacteraceae bacterium]|jgi:hypothetical protein|nr:hypothetical protein [Solirubrobacteraceae bacterium]